MVVSLFFLGCQVVQNYKGNAGGDADGKTITAVAFLDLPDEAQAGVEDKTDYLKLEKEDPLDAVDETLKALSPLGAMFPMGGLILGALGTASRMARKYRPLIKEGKADAQALYELVRGIDKAANGSKIESVSGATLSLELSSSMSDTSKARVGALLERLGHQKVDSGS